MKWKPAILALLLIFTINDSNGTDNDPEADKNQQTTSPPSTETRTDAEIESDMVAIESVWNSLQTALLANDIQFALQHFTPNSRERYNGLFEMMGPAMSKMPGTWSDFTAIRIGNEMATYAFTQKESNGDRLHSVAFVRHPMFGWLIQTM